MRIKPAIPASPPYHIVALALTSLDNIFILQDSRTRALHSHCNMAITHTGLTPAVLAFKPTDPPVEEIQPPTDRARLADPSKAALLSAAKVKHLTPYIGTELQGVQLSQLDEKQRDELALLVAEVSLPPSW
jgi:hypothetical protein